MPRPELRPAIPVLLLAGLFCLTPAFAQNSPQKKLVGYAIYKLLAREPAGQRQLNDPRVQQDVRQRLREARSQLLKTAYYEMLHDQAKIVNYEAENIFKQK